VYAARKTRGRVVAVEPFPQNVEYLRRNVGVNDCDVEVSECALSDKDGTARLYVSDNGSTHQLFEKSHDGMLQDFVEVPSRSLASFMDEKELAAIDLLKLDCEGAEGLILPAAAESVLQRVRRISLEFHDYASPLDHDALAELLQAAGYATSLRWDGVAQNGYLYAHQS
jgi:FkbM family methyltransferase